MTRDVHIDSAQETIVLGWRSGEQGLFLRVRGQTEEVRLVCRCGRSHWIVREQFSAGVASFAVTCHSCGARGTFRMEGVRMPVP